MAGEHIHAVSTDEGKRLAKEIGAVNYFECSVFKGIGVEEIFAEVVWQHYLKK